VIEVHLKIHLLVWVERAGHRDAVSNQLALIENRSSSRISHELLIYAFNLLKGCLMLLFGLQEFIKIIIVMLLQSIQAKARELGIDLSLLGPLEDLVRVISALPS